MIEFPLIGGTYPSRSRAASPQRTINYFPEGATKGNMVLVGAPGYSRIKDFSKEGRGALPHEDKLYAVLGSIVYEFNEGLAETQIGTLLTSTGRVSMAHNGTELMIVDGQDGWLYDGTFTKITDSTFTATKADQVVFKDGYFVVNEPGTQRMWMSAAYDGSSWTGTDTASAEFRPDNLVSLVEDRELWGFGTNTIGVFQNSGAASGFIFKPIRQANQVYGIAARDSVASLDNTLYWLGRHKTGQISVFRASGYQPKKVSTPALEYHWASYPDTSKAFAISMFFKGHSWYVLTFPEADHGLGRTFVYSSEYNMWWEWGEWRPHIDDYSKFPMVAHAFFAGKHIIFDVNGDMHELDDDIYTFNGETIVSERWTPAIHESRRRIFHRRLQVDMDVGHGDPDGDLPRLRVSASDDGGKTWNNWRDADIGYVGETTARARVIGLGSAFDRVYRLQYSSPNKRIMIGGWLEAA